MQRVTYQNADGREAVFGLAPPFIFEKITGLHALEAALRTSETPGHSGSQFYGLRLPDRELALSFHIEGKSRQDMYEKRLELLSVLSAAEGASGRVVYQNDAGSWWIPAIVKQGPVADSRLQNFNHCQAVFYCPDPYWRGMEETGADLAFTGFGLEFPFEMELGGGVEFGEATQRAAVVNRGSAAAPVRIRVMGPADRPKISKEATGEYIRLKTVLDSGETLVIDTTPGKASVHIAGAADQERSGFGYLDLNSVLFQLEPGENMLRYESADDTQRTRVSVSFYDSYEGV